MKKLVFDFVGLLVVLFFMACFIAIFITAVFCTSLPMFWFLPLFFGCIYGVTLCIISIIEGFNCYYYID